ncbi:hypothetical protein C1645_813683 [Glomus cerebriforme]|uniref:Zinc-ribbon domain-containing protein n=1 Tax=Glomus cerebriforme TaxID=658196 RepID=A0A397THU1_9GLOM|nr:hypothetical protein C1645_813683 [Glomus cerebriforme]
MAKLTLNIAKEIACSRGGKCISERYINCQIPMLWKCTKDHLWSARLNMKKFAEKKGGFCLTTEYINRWDPLEWQCKEGHKHDHITHQPIDIANSIVQERGGKCLFTEYVNANTQMLWRCVKGHEWSTTLYRIKNMGRWCSQCASNFPCGLSEAKKIAHNKEDFLKIPEHPQGLELDIYYPQYGFAIEVQVTALISKIYKCNQSETLLLRKRDSPIASKNRNNVPLRQIFEKFVALDFSQLIKRIFYHRYDTVKYQEFST